MITNAAIRAPSDTSGTSRKLCESRIQPTLTFLSAEFRSASLAEHRMHRIRALQASAQVGLVPSEQEVHIAYEAQPTLVHTDSAQMTSYRRVIFGQFDGTSDLGFGNSPL